MNLHGYWLLTQSPALPGHLSLVALAMGRGLSPVPLTDLEVVMVLEQATRSGWVTTCPWGLQPTLGEGHMWLLNRHGP